LHNRFGSGRSAAR